MKRLGFGSEIIAAALTAGFLAFSVVRCGESECQTGDAQCLGTLVQTCEEGLWADFNDCSASRMTCAVLNGSPSCVVPSTPTCDNDPSTSAPPCACDSDPSTPAPPC